MILVWLAACAGGGSDFSSGDAAAGADVYASTCQSCHGEDGTAGVGGASDLNVEVPEKSDDELAEIIQNGVGDMPAQNLDDTETADVIAYLRETFGG
jgi:cytochrome c551